MWAFFVVCKFLSIPHFLKNPFYRFCNFSRVKTLQPNLCDYQEKLMWKVDDFVEATLSGLWSQNLKVKLILSQISFSQQKLSFQVIRLSKTLKQLKSLIILHNGESQTTWCISPFIQNINLFNLASWLARM